MNLPDALPILSAGHHDPDSGYACAMDAVSWLSGKPEEGDAPSCVHPLLQSQFIRVNDDLPDGERHKLWPLIVRAMGTAPDGLSDLERRVLSVRLAVWCARQVSHLTAEEHREPALAAIGAAERWCDEPTAAADAAYDYAAYDYAAYAYAAHAAAYACAACAAYANADYAAYACAANAYAAAYAANDDAYAGGLVFLEGLINEHAQLTATTPTPVDPERLTQLADTVGVR